MAMAFTSTSLELPFAGVSPGARSVNIPGTQLTVNSTSPQSSIDGIGIQAAEIDKLLVAAPRSPNLYDAEDQGKDPITLKRSCTDCPWTIPFIAALGVFAYCVINSKKHGKLGVLTTLPDLHGQLCGFGDNDDKQFLFFCMDKASQWVMDEKNKSLDIASPICLSKCPTSFNTSSHCFQGRNLVTQVETWDWVQDYPSTEYLGMLCRPHQAFAHALFEDFEHFMDNAPPTAAVSFIFRAWQPLVWAIGVTVFCSYVWIAALGFCARCLVWSAMMLVFVGNAVLSAYFCYCFKAGACDGEPGRQDTDMQFLGFGALTGCVAVFCICQMSRLSDELEVAGQVIEWSCKCILNSPSLLLLPFSTLIWRIMITSLWGYSVLNYMTAELNDHYSETSVLYGNDIVEWSINFAVSPVNWLRIGAVTFACIWINGVITAASCFIMFYTGQVWYLRGGMDTFVASKTETVEGGRVPFCVYARAWWAMVRYHYGSLVIGGLLITFLQPFHLFVGAITELSRSETNPVGMILGGCCGICIQLYTDWVEHLSRDAFMDVCLQGMPFLKAAYRVARSNEGIESLRVLNGATNMFELAGIGAMCAFGYITVANAVTLLPVFHDPMSPDYVERPEFLCFIGGALSFLTALPFMTLFDVVSDSVLHSKALVKQRHAPLEKAGPARRCPTLFNMVQDFPNYCCATRGGAVVSAPSPVTPTWAPLPEGQVMRTVTASGLPLPFSSDPGLRLKEDQSR